MVSRLGIRIILTIHAKCVIDDNDETDIQPNKTYLALANEVDGSSNLCFSKKDMRNYIIRKLHSTDDNVDLKEMLKYQSKLLYAIDIDESYKLKSALWVDEKCKASYEYFGDMVSFHTIYKKNKHALPFTSFVGVNHHGKSTLFGCALLGNEDIPSFEWIPTHWVKCMGIVPQGIITNQCKAMFGAIKKGPTIYSSQTVHMAHHEEDTPEAPRLLLLQRFAC
ncbi:hypothetical protein Ahy_B07g087088 [Arachis hypogaea]|uniref:MULE transposase domain-containing protein n=1 Tax=Arachis hypogaea TaxID=3818 RepID=A0A444YBA9_ARAHY|nr:hypothetical protein Ahy_B07g087088 [Arachis hypogaea]